jgi:hypothetical protein
MVRSYSIGAQGGMVTAKNPTAAVTRLAKEDWDR